MSLEATTAPNRPAPTSPCPTLCSSSTKTRLSSRQIMANYQPRCGAAFKTCKSRLSILVSLQSQSKPSFYPSIFSLPNSVVTCRDRRSFQLIFIFVPFHKHVHRILILISILAVSRSPRPSTKKYIFLDRHFCLYIRPSSMSGCPLQVVQVLFKSEYLINQIR